MPFNSEAFKQAHFEPRTATIKVPELAEWFDGPAEWIVRAPAANDLARANEAKARLDRTEALAQALASGTGGEVLREAQRALGRSNDTEPDIARRMELIEACSVDPVCDREMSLKLAQFAPVQFYQVTNRILILSGQGPATAKKRKRSGAIPASELPSASPT
jgi:hypothetical protein